MNKLILFCLGTACGSASAPLLAQCCSEVLVTEDPNTDDALGESVDMEGSRIVCGTVGDDEGGINCGAAYVFDRQGLAWTQTAKLIPSDGGILKDFGRTIDLHGDQLIVGARFDDHAGTRSGSAYVFERLNGQWYEAAKLVSPTAAEDEWFGQGVAIGPDIAIVGKVGDFGVNPGSVFVYRKQGAAWALDQEILLAGGTVRDQFGFAVALEGTRLVIGAPNRDTSVVQAGEVYVYDEVGGTFVFTTSFRPTDPRTFASFGAALDIDAGRIVVGAPRFDLSTFNRNGKVYVFREEPGGYVEEDSIYITNISFLDNAGRDVTLEGDRMVFGSSDSIAFVYDFDGVGWVENHRTPNAGISVALSGDVLATGYTNFDIGAIDRAGAVIIESQPTTIGVAYCTPGVNSTGATATLVARGCRDVGRNDFTLFAGSLPSNQFGYFLTARTQGATPLGGGSQGLLCLGFPVLRFDGDVLATGAGSSVRFSPPLFAFPQGNFVNPGETWNFQLWYRDNNPAATSNTSEAVAVTWATNGPPSVQFPITSTAIVEQTTQFEIPIVLSQPHGVAVSVPFTHMGTATNQVDYRIESTNPLIIPAGAVGGALLVTIAQDTVDEPDETVTITLGTPGNAVLGAEAVHLLTILDDD